MAAVVYPFLVLSAVGFVAMLVIHVASLCGITAPFEHLLTYLGPGVFVVFLPTIWVMNQLTRDFKQKDIWRAALRGCPQWMYRTVWVICGYAWVGFFALPFLYGGGMDSESNQARMLSGTLLVFYLIPLALLYSWSQARHFDEGRRCLNGHHVSPLAKFCEECGASVALPVLNRGK
jgi:hypothetical protein